MTIYVNINKTENGQDLPTPAYATQDSAGLDLLAANVENITILPGKRAIVPTGIIIELPRQFEAQIRPRSGLAAKNGITVLNSPGTIDADYRGEIKVILINLGDESFVIERGMRIAQMVIAPYSHVTLTENDVNLETTRAGGGFGSTGM